MCFTGISGVAAVVVCFAANNDYLCYVEELMQYVWQHRLWLQQDMRTVDGRRVQVLDPGSLNRGSGPDFFNAKVKIDGRVWAGDVEIHVKASDWARHGHDGNRAYESVILHVVDRDDAVIHRADGEVIPQLRMPCSPDFHLRYKALVDRADRDLPCAERMRETAPVYLTDWLSTLGYERIYDKCDRVTGLLERVAGDWESVCYVTVARCLGFGVNGDPFERLALSVPLPTVGKHSDDLKAIEALLFGQSGLIETAADDYSAELQREYGYLRHKFGLTAPESLNWKMSGMRPGNFPHRRIALLARLLHGGFRMLSRILDVESVDDAMCLFASDPEGYWRDHYVFGTAAARSAGTMSEASVRGMVINAVVPLQFAYGTVHGRQDLTDRAVELLLSLPAERNMVVRMFEAGGIKARDAFTSQALIQLRRNYCERHKCLYCRVGHRMLALDARRVSG